MEKYSDLLRETADMLDNGRFNSDMLKIIIDRLLMLVSNLVRYEMIYRGAPKEVE